MSLNFAEGGDRAPRSRRGGLCVREWPVLVRPDFSPLAATGRPFKSWGAGAPTTSVNPLSQRNCYRPRTRTSCRWSGAARGASDAWPASVGRYCKCLYSASQLSELCALFSAPALYKTGAPLSTPWVERPSHRRLKPYTDRCRGRTKFRQTIHLLSAEIKSFSQLSPKKGSHFRHA